jgi:phenylpropionate dioxygenase-like ring-hydroxylating dioxygenase large terminal subunit
VSDAAFPDFANVWTPVALATSLRPGQPLAVRVAGTPLVLFRGADGRPAALLDRCIHRGVALSLGRVRDGCIECPFHGWRYDAAGRVVNVPWNPDAKLATLASTGVPVRELGGQIWIYTSFSQAPAAEPQVHEAIVAPGVRVAGRAIDWQVHWTRAMENMLDWPHLPFVHAATIGRQLARRADRRMDIEVEDQPWGFRSRIRIDGELERGVLDFRWPNQMNLHIPIRNRLLFLMVACVPIDERRTRMVLMAARNFLTWSWLDRLFDRTNLKIALEDQAIVESSSPPAVPDAREEKSVRTDAPVLRFRRAYFERLKTR